ncbi:MAG: Ig-like domain-containing protein, partial [candidate division Zixibacteria bacterium]
LTFYATDDSLAVDSEVVVITVNEVGNQAPVLDPVGDYTTTEGIELLFAVSASDGESIPLLSASILPAGAVFVDSGNGIGTFIWTPNFVQSGIYNVTFYATDDSLVVDSEVVTITVIEAGNQTPVLDSIGAQTTPEGLQLLFIVTASDGESIPVLTTSVLPSGAVFVDSGNGSASFDWLPDFTQAGIYNVTFYATDDSAVVDSELLAITVTESGNPPVLDSISDTTVTEAVLLSFTVTATDPDSTIPTLSTSALPAGATFVDSGNGTGEFSWIPNYLQNGIYQITFYATDGQGTDSQFVTITVLDVGNQTPIIDSIGDRTVAEGANLAIIVTASDGESIPVLTTTALPIGAIFADSGNGTGYFDWTPGFTQSGSYPITFYATDDSLAVDSQLITITVTESGDQPPVFDSLPDFMTTELDTLIITVRAVDPESTAISLAVIFNSTSFTFVDSGNGVGVLTYIPSLFDAGLDTVKFLATDSGSPPRTTIIVSVITTIENNQPPVFDSAGPYAVEVNDTLIFTVFASDSTDQDTTHSVFLTTTGLPANASFTDNGDNTGTITFAPVPGQEGFDTLGFLATDEGTPALSGILDVGIMVVGVNIPPVLNPIGAQSVREGDLLTINLSGYDPDSTMIPFFTVDSSNLTGAITFADSGNGTAVFTYVPTFLESGLLNVTFEIHDGIDFDKEDVIIQVTDFGNRLPLYDSIPSPSVAEGDSLVVFLTAYDPDDGPVVLSIDEAATPLPPNFIFTDSGGGLATLELYPVFNQSGTYPLDLVVADDSSTADTFSMIVQIIEAGPQPPLLDSIPDYSLDEATNLTFTITTSDIDSVPPILTTSELPGSSSFTDNEDYTGTFSWTPTHDDSGTYTVTFYATDADPATTMVDSQEITIVVNDVNRAPFLNLPAPSNTMNEFDTLSLYFTAFDQDGSTPSIRVTLSGADTMATNMTFFDSGNGAGVFTFIPDHTQGDEDPTSFNYIVTAIDEFDTTLTQSSGTRTIRVNNVNVVPTLNFLDGVGPFNIVEGEAISIRVLAEDIDGIITSLDATNLPLGATFSGPIIYFKTVNWTPLFNQAGSYTINISTSDNDSASANQSVQINVAEFGNHAPSFTTTLPDTIEFFVGVAGNIVVKAQDLDFDNITISLDLGPLSSTFVDSGNGTAVHSFLPDSALIDSVIPVRFIVTDVPAGLTDTLTTSYWVRDFLRGDLDGTFNYTMNDVVFLVNYIYRDGPEPDPLQAGDVDASGAINTADLSYLVNFIYRGGPAPPQ